MISEIVRKHQLKTAAKIVSRMPTNRTLTLEDFLLPQMKIDIQKDVWYLKSMKVTMSQPDVKDIEDDDRFEDNYSPYEEEMSRQVYIEYMMDTSMDLKAWFFDGWEGSNPGHILLDKYIPPTQVPELHWSSIDVYEPYSSENDSLYFEFNGDPLYENADTISEQDFFRFIRNIVDQALIIEQNLSFVPIGKEVVESGVGGVIAKPSRTVMLEIGGIFFNLTIEWTFFKPNEEGDS